MVLLRVVVVGVCALCVCVLFVLYYAFGYVLWCGCVALVCCVLVCVVMLWLLWYVLFCGVVLLCANDVVELCVVVVFVVRVACCVLVGVVLFVALCNGGALLVS